MPLPFSPRHLNPRHLILATFTLSPSNYVVPDCLLPIKVNARARDLNSIRRYGEGTSNRSCHLPGGATARKFERAHVGTGGGIQRWHHPRQRRMSRERRMSRRRVRSRRCTEHARNRCCPKTCWFGYIGWQRPCCPSPPLRPPLALHPRAAMIRFSAYIFSRGCSVA